jgi:hypothetical protein
MTALGVPSAPSAGHKLTFAKCWLDHASAACRPSTIGTANQRQMRSNLETYESDARQESTVMKVPVNCRVNARLRVQHFLSLHQSPFPEGSP